jgi:[NiFe] hydrogenase small subunit
VLKKKLETEPEISRRSFLKFCGVVAGALGLGPGAAVDVARALTSSERPPVIWLHFAECTGCSEAILRTTGPFFDELIMNVISLEYHETLMAAAGQTVEEALTKAANDYKGKFFGVVEGAIPVAINGAYGMIGGKTMLSIAEEILPKAKAIISCGTCASYGGLPAASPNPTGAKGVSDALPRLKVPIVNVPGCPPNPVNIVGVVADYLLNGRLPPLDSHGRPLFAYGRKVHDLCPYEDGKQEHRCLEHEGCKGERCHNNCPEIGFNEGMSFPMKAGHPCIGCSEPNFWDTMTPFYREHGSGGNRSEEHDSEEHDSEETTIDSRRYDHD